LLMAARPYGRRGYRRVSNRPILEMKLSGARLSPTATRALAGNIADPDRQDAKGERLRSSASPREKNSVLQGLSCCMASSAVRALVPQELRAASLARNPAGGRARTRLFPIVGKRLPCLRRPARKPRGTVKSVKFPSGEIQQAASGLARRRAPPQLVISLIPIDRMKKAITTTAHASSRITICRKFSKKPT